MIKWWKNRRRKARLFKTKTALKRHIQQLSMKDRDLYISYVSSIRRFLHSGNQQEVINRSKWLKYVNLEPPKTIEECNQMIDDLREYYV